VPSSSAIASHDDGRRTTFVVRQVTNAEEFEALERMMACDVVLEVAELRHCSSFTRSRPHNPVVDHS